MGRIKLKLTNEHISLIKNIRFNRIRLSQDNIDILRLSNKLEKRIASLDDSEPVKDECMDLITLIKGRSNAMKDASEIDDDRYYGIDTYAMLTYSEMSDILGYNDKIIKGSEENWSGPSFDDDTKQHLDELFDFIFENLINIEELIHQRSDKGGIQPDTTYIAYDNEHIWYTEEEFKSKRKRGN